MKVLLKDVVEIADLRVLEKSILMEYIACGSYIINIPILDPIESLSNLEKYMEREVYGIAEDPNCILLKKE